MKRRFFLLHAVCQPQHQVSMIYKVELLYQKFCLRLHQKLSQSMKIPKQFLGGGGMPPDPSIVIRNVAPPPPPHAHTHTLLHHWWSHTWPVESTNAISIAILYVGIIQSHSTKWGESCTIVPSIREACSGCPASLSALALSLLRHTDKLNIYLQYVLPSNEQNATMPLCYKSAQVNLMGSVKWSNAIKVSLDYIWAPLTLSISNISECTVIIQIPYPTKWAWPFSGISQRIDNFAQTPSYSLGSNYPKTVELASAKWNAYESYYRSSTNCNIIVLPD